MTETDFQIVPDGNATPCFHCRIPFDPLTARALMPKLDGRELCRRLKGDERTQGIKIIVMSAIYHGTTYRNEAFKSFHVDEYLEKPVKPGVLREAVDRLMPEIARAHSHSNDVRLAS